MVQELSIQALTGRERCAEETGRSVGGPQSRIRGVGASGGPSCEGLAPSEGSYRTIRPSRLRLGYSERLDQRSRVRGEGLKHVPTLLLGGRDHRAEGDEGIGTLLRPEAARDFLLDLHHPPVPLRLVVGEGNVGIGEEAQHVFLAGAQAQQEVVTGAPSLAASALALASPLERGLGLMEGYSFLEDTLVAFLEEVDQRRFQPHAM